MQITESADENFFVTSFCFLCHHLLRRTLVRSYLNSTNKKTEANHFGFYFDYNFSNNALNFSLVIIFSHP
ncbi:MAG: hypothetical protein KGL19_02985, partial [Bacteroidota bacterium]|nr:hypothetical protein [Bacteroidota bacterium]